MSRLSAIHPTQAEGLADTLFAGITKAVGKVPNAYATVGTHSPESLAAILALDQALAKTSLSRADVEAIKLAVSAHAGCDYCVAAHSLMGQKAGLADDALRQIRAGGDTGQGRLDALLRFVRTLVQTQGTVPANEVEACALGKLSCVGVLVSGGRPGSCGRRRRTTSLIAVFSA